MARRRWTRALAVLALGAGLMTMPAAGAEQTPDDEFPNLPARQNRSAGQNTPSILSGYVTNLAFVRPSGQWVRMLDVKVAADVAIFAVAGQKAQCELLFGAGSQRCVEDRPDLGAKLPVRALAYPLEFAGDDPSSPPADRSELRRFAAKFTEFPTQRIRTVAFGSIPVEADLNLSLPTDGRGLPIGLQIDTDNYGGSPPIDLTDTVASGRLEVRLSNVTIDGIRTEVSDNCRALGDLSAEGRGFVITRGPDVQVVPPGRYNPRVGGTLQGTLAVGSFSGCVGRGSDDLSPVLTSFAGRTDLPIRILQGEVTSLCFVDNVRQPIIEADCRSGGVGEFPEGDALPDLPPEFLPAPPQD